MSRDFCFDIFRESISLGPGVIDTGYNGSVASFLKGQGEIGKLEFEDLVHLSLSMLATVN